MEEHKDSDEFDGHFDYRRVIGMLNYLEKCTRPDIGYAVHQCARFVAHPKQEHGNAVKWICRYLLGTRDKGIMWKMNEFNKEEKENSPVSLIQTSLEIIYMTMINRMMQTLQEEGMDI